jgi:hypothetical protein
MVDPADLEWFENLACLACLSPCGDDVRFCLMQNGLEQFVQQPRSPGGKPLNCCCINHVMKTIVEPRAPEPLGKNPFKSFWHA